MAENKFEAKHIASLDVDVSKIYKKFAELNEAAQKESKEFYKSFTKGFEQQSSNNKTTESLDSIAKGIKKVGDEAEKSKKKTESFLNKIIDKVYWTAAFRITNTLFSIPKQIWEVMKETETAIVEITRVLNDATIDVKEFTQEVYDLAIQYGRTFDDAAEITRKFAQAGYSGTESLGLMEQALVALNTAELDANQATTGLIAVMKQLGWTNQESVENLDLLIDKINITADSFAVNSETLISALQKVAGTATNSGQSLDDMIGIITVLSEATGASGEQIGNAYKSIISYIQRASSLATFESLGIEVYADKVKGTLLPINDILDNLANSWQGWTEAAQTSFIAKNTDLIDTLNELSDATGEYQTTLESLNDTAEIGNTIEERTAAQAAAGMHRRNYFISLMNNYNEIQEVTNKLAEAEGYSLEENARTMETLQAKMNALTTSLRALAYEAGQAGFIDLAKATIDFAVGLTKVIQATGGVNNLLRTTIALIMIIKAQDMAKNITGLGKSLTTLGQSMKGVVTNLRATTAAMNAQKTATEATTAATVGLQGALGIIGIALLAVSAAISVVSKVQADNNAKKEEAIRLANESVDLAKEEAKTLDDLIKKYKELNNAKDGTWNDAQVETVKNIQAQIVELLGDQADGVDIINGKYDEQIEKLKQISLEQAKQAQIDLANALNLSEQALKDLKIGGNSVRLGFMSATTDYAQLEKQIIEKYFNLDVNRTNSVLGMNTGSVRSYEVTAETPETTQEIISFYDKLVKVRQELFDSYGKNAKAMSAESELYQGITDKINQLTPAIKDYEQKLADYAGTNLYIKYNENIKNSFLTTEEDIKRFVLLLETVTVPRRGSTDTMSTTIAGYTAEERKILLELIKKDYPEYFKVVKEGTDVVISSQEKYNKLVAETKVSLKNLTNAFDTLKTATEEYNSTGTISLNTLTSLIELEPQYIAMLFDETGAINTSTNAYNDKFNAMLKVMEAQKLDEMITWINGLTKEQIAVEGLSSAYNSLGQSMMTSKLQGLGEALAQKVAEGILTTQQAGQLANALKSYFAMFSDIALSNSSNYGNYAKKSAQLQLDWLNFYGKNANSQIAAYEYLLSEQTALDEDRLDTLRKIAQLKIKIAEDEADALIAAKKREWAEIDEAEDRRNRKKELTDELAYWSLRGTSEAVKKREEIRQQIAEFEAENQKTDDRAAELMLLEQSRDAKIDQLLLQYGGLEKEVVLSIARDAFRAENVVSINNSMGTIIGKLDEIKNKFMPSITVTVSGTNASSEDIAKVVRGEIERVIK